MHRRTPHQLKTSYRALSVGTLALWMALLSLPALGSTLSLGTAPDKLSYPSHSRLSVIDSSADSDAQASEKGCDRDDSNGAPQVGCHIDPLG